MSAQNYCYNFSSKSSYEEKSFSSFLEQNGNVVPLTHEKSLSAVLVKLLCALEASPEGASGYIVDASGSVLQRHCKACLN